MTLDALQPGQRYRIEAVDPSDAVVRRLMILGLVEGAEVSLAGAAIGGDPLEVLVFGNAISLRREHARHFRVTPVTDLG